jgi:NodT family efflux transporter outer membrane factor (OMF) lipoprotein
VYYGDIHGHSQPLDADSLSTHHVFHASATPKAAYWWGKFKDPELNQLIAVALSDSPDMQSAENRVRRAEHLADGAVAGLWPEIDLSGYVERERFSEFGLVPPPFNGKTFNIGQVGFNFNYEFDFWGKNRQTLAARVSEACAAQADLAQARLIISAAVANVYFQLLGDIKQLQLAKDNLKQLKEILGIVVDRAKNGIESDIPVKTAIANVQAAVLAVEQYQRAEMLSRHQLAVLLGKNPFATSIMTHRFRYHAYHIALPTCLSANLLAHRPDIFAAKARAEAAAHQINVAKAGFFPDINLNAFFTYQSVKFGRLFDTGSQNNGILGAIDLPIFDAGARRANLGVKYAEYDLAVNEYNQTILTALREVADQASILKTLKAEVAAQATALNATQRHYKLINSRYNHGIVDYVQVLEVKELLLQQQARQVSLQTSHLQAVVVMLKALGGTQG